MPGLAVVSGAAGDARRWRDRDGGAGARGGEGVRGARRAARGAPQAASCVGGGSGEPGPGRQRSGGRGLEPAAREGTPVRDLAGGPGGGGAVIWPYVGLFVGLFLVQVALIGIT